MFDDGSERIGRKERQRADDHDDADQQRDEDPRMCRERAGAFGHGLFAGQRAGKRERRNGNRKAAEHHVDAGHEVVKEIRTQAGKGRSVIGVGRRERVENLGEAVGTARYSSVAKPARRHRQRSRWEPSESTGVTSAAKNRELHFAALDLLAEILRRAPHHQTRDEYGQAPRRRSCRTVRCRRRRRRSRRVAC